MILTDHITALQDIARFAKINVNNCKLRFKEFVEKDRVELTALAAKGGSIPAATGKPLYTYDDHCISAFFAAYLKASEALRAAVIRGGMSDVDYDALDFTDIGIDKPDPGNLVPHRKELWNYKTGAVSPKPVVTFRSLDAWESQPIPELIYDINKYALKAENINGYTSMLRVVPAYTIPCNYAFLYSWASFEDPTTMTAPWTYPCEQIGSIDINAGRAQADWYTCEIGHNNQYAHYNTRELHVNHVCFPASTSAVPLLGAPDPTGGYILKDITSIYIDYGVYTKDYSFNFMPFLQGYFGPHKQDFGPAWEERVDGNLNNVLVKKVRTFKEARASSYFKNWFETEVEDLFDPVSFTASVKNTKGLQQICNLYAVKYALLKVIYGHTKRLQTI